MRKFFSYGPPDIEENYYAPRKELLDTLYHSLTGDNSQKGGHYFTVWAPRQTGKTWCLNMVRYRLAAERRFDVVKISLEDLKTQTDSVQVIKLIVNEIFKQLEKEPVIHPWKRSSCHSQPGQIISPIQLLLTQQRSILQASLYP